MTAPTNITRFLTTSAEKNNVYGITLQLHPPAHDSKLTERFRSAEENYSSSFLKRRASDETISQCFTKNGTLVHFTKISSTEHSLKAPGQMGLFGKQERETPQDDILASNVTSTVLKDFTPK